MQFKKWLIAYTSLIGLIISVVPIYAQIKGSSLSADDILDWPSFWSKLIHDANKDSPNPGKRIWQLLPQEVQSLIERSANDSLFLEEDKSGIIDTLNGLLEQQDFYQEQDYSSTDLAEEAKELLERYRNTLSSTYIQTLNRLLIEAAYPSKIAKSKQNFDISGKLSGGIRSGGLIPSTELNDKLGLEEYAFLRYKLRSQWQIEGNLGHGRMLGKNYGTDMGLMAAKLLYEPMVYESEKLNPYLYGGLGVLRYDLDKITSKRTPDAEVIGWSVIIPGGIGIQYKLKDDIAFEISTGFTYTFRDDINGGTLKKGNDTFFELMIGITAGGNFRRKIPSWKYPTGIGEIRNRKDFNEDKKIFIKHLTKRLEEAQSNIESQRDASFALISMGIITSALVSVIIKDDFTFSFENLPPPITSLGGAFFLEKLKTQKTKSRAEYLKNHIASFDSYWSGRVPEELMEEPTGDPENPKLEDYFEKKSKILEDIP